jgi:hypothetical protein
VPARRTCLALLAGAFIASRILCFAAGVRFDIEPLDFYWQYIDPALLRYDFWRSIFYLEQQPPAFNFFLGTILHLFPADPQIGFQLIYLGLGLALSLSLFELMDRMGVNRRLALAIALVFTLSPSTILYENLLFYEYPLVALFSIAALFLHRFATDGRLRNGMVFFTCAALIAGIRSIFHLVWFCAIALSLVWAVREWRKQVVLAAAAPGLLLAAFYGKHFLLFHNFVPGGKVIGGANIAAIMTGPVPRPALEGLIASGEITPILRANIFHFGEDFEASPSESSLARIVPVPTKTGIPVLDQCRKSTDEINWNCVWAERVAQVYERDSLVVFRHYPEAYLTSLRRNLEEYFWADTDLWPFDGRENDANQRILTRPLALYNLFTSGEWPLDVGRPWLAYFLLPVLLGFGVFEAWLALRASGSVEKARGITLAFLVGNAVYLSVVVILFSASDQNRYRSEVSAYFAVLLGLALTRVARTLRSSNP